jgi:hypothetical protein
VVEPINPYESPVVPLAELPRIDGPWRHGQLLVMDIRSELPPFCVLSGEPADGAREVDIVGRKAGELFTSTFNIWLPLRRLHLQSYRSARWRSVIGLGFGALTILGVICLPMMANRLQDLLACAMCPLIIFGFVGVALWLSAYQFSKGPLLFVRAERNYLWLAGAHPKFLARLPEWPGS